MIKNCTQVYFDVSLTDQTVRSATSNKISFYFCNTINPPRLTFSLPRSFSFFHSRIQLLALSTPPPSSCICGLDPLSAAGSFLPVGTAYVLKPTICQILLVAKENHLLYFIDFLFLFLCKQEQVIIVCFVLGRWRGG